MIGPKIIQQHNGSKHTAQASKNYLRTIRDPLNVTVCDIK